VNLVERLTEFSSRFSGRQKAIAGGVAVVLVAGGAIGGTIALTSGGDNDTVAVISSPPVTSATPSPTPTPKPKPKPKPNPKAKLMNPLTGIGAPPKGPVIGVKIDDTGNGRPQRGIDRADIVYIEQAEGGLTRLLAVFATHKPVVEAVRSVRASDPELLTQYGPIALVASGGGGDSLPTLHKSILHGVINDAGGPGFSRDGGRGAPYNLTSNLSQVSRAIHSGGSRDIGFDWKAKPGLGATPKASSVHTVVGGTPVTFDWSPKLGRYVRVIDGSQQHAASGALISTPNVIVQYCSVSVNRGDVDVTGNPSQYTHSVGHGRVAVFRNGHRIEGTWSRLAKSTGTKLLDKHHKPIMLAPGGAWVVLVANGAPLST
jgi:hypothetical protein